MNQALINSYQQYLDEQGIPQMSADEILVEESLNLTQEQREKIEYFYKELELSR